MKTYGAIEYNKKNQQWIITRALPHVCIKLKAIFHSIAMEGVLPFHFSDSPERCSDLVWFMSRYPLEASRADRNRLEYGNTVHVDLINKLETIFLPNYQARPISLKNDFTARPYQLKANELLFLNKRYLLGDDLGLGKTLSGILGFFNPGALPAAVVCDTNLTWHWEQQIAKFTDLKTHVIRTRKAYSLPEGIDVFIFTYSKLLGWVDLFKTAYFKYALYDEVQELRHKANSKGEPVKKHFASNILSQNATYALGMSATPIYNTAIEIHNILSLLKEGCLSSPVEFVREWQGFSDRVRDPQALGTYLRDSFLFLRRTREEVGMEMPAVNTIIHEVPYDHEAVENERELLQLLAVAVTKGSFAERGQAGRELDLRLRQLTGISKAKYVAAYVRMLLMSGESVLLAGWHREVYQIWEKELEEFKPCWYTGSETPAGKNESKEKFESGECKLMFISLRSAKGIDGLQNNCSVVVHGELDWTPQVHNQLIGRVNRPGQTKPVMSIYLISDGGSDPVMVELLGLKASQAHNIVNPLLPMPEQHSDESRVKMMAKMILDKYGDSPELKAAS